MVHKMCMRTLAKAVSSVHIQQQRAVHPCETSWLYCISYKFSRNREINKCWFAFFPSLQCILFPISWHILYFVWWWILTANHMLEEFCVQSLVLQILVHKPKYWTTLQNNFDQMVVNEKSGDHWSYYNSSWGEHQCLCQMSRQYI